MSEAATTPAVVTPEQFLTHWQAHRRLTRRLIEAYPEDQLFTFSVGGMRPFGTLVRELLGMAVPTARGVVTDEWSAFEDAKGDSKAELLRQWDQSTAELDEWFRQIPIKRFQETKTAFGQYTMPVYDLLFYIVDNEIHHRGQGYVYLRALGTEPPAFWDRS